MTYDSDVYAVQANTRVPTPLELMVCALDSFWSRLRGLMFRAPLPSGCGVLLSDCAAIHTCFMRFSIGVIFLSRNGVVLKVVGNLRPWRVAVCGNGRYVIEVGSSDPIIRRIRVGDQLFWTR